MKRKIILIIFLPQFVVSGAGRSVFEMINGLDKKKFIIKVICFGKCEYKKKLRKKIDIYELKTKKIIYGVLKIIQIVKLIKNVSGQNKLIFISNHHYANVVGFFVKRKIHKIKTIGIERTAIFELKTFFSFTDLLRKKILMLFVKFTYPYLDKIVANSNFVENEIKKFSPKNTMVIYPPSFIKKEKKSMKKYGLKILMVGSLNKEKGISLALKALSKIDKNFILTIVGRGSEKNKLILLSKKLFGENYKKKIKFVGHQNNLKKYYLRSNLFLNTSFFEGFSNAIIDAMNHNIPVIASDCAGGNQEILKNGRCGLIFKSRDETDLRVKIYSFLENKKLYFKKASEAKNHIKKYSSKNSIKEYSNLFERI
tara:strand:+ start:7794 stop:8897 length:1104 start_codon:yes stop_codon:yes gene_type:complete